MANRFKTIDSFPGMESEEETGPVIGDAVGMVRREKFSEIWKARHAAREGSATEPSVDDDAAPLIDEEPSDEDERMGQAMEDHPDLHKYFDDPGLLDENGLTEDRYNPYAHISIHVIVENQLAEGKPPQIREHLERLQTAGLSRHDAVHEIAQAVTLMIHEVLAQNRAFDEARYLKALEDIVAGVEKRAGPPPSS